jgi:hypothetical protein
LEDGKLKLEKIHTRQNPADMLTKGVTREKLMFLLSFSWSSRMNMKMRNFPGPRRFRVYHIQAVVELLRSVSKWEIIGCGA